MWKGVKKTEKLSVVTLGLCIVALAAIIIFRPFWSAPNSSTRFSTAFLCAPALVSRRRLRSRLRSGCAGLEKFTFGTSRDAGDASK